MRTIAIALATAPLALQAPTVLAQNVDLGNLGNRGFRIDGIDAGDRSGTSVSGAGDVNGDGLADLIVGAFNADPGGVSNAGESYVLFGKASSAPVDLANLGNGGFRIDGVDASDISGLSVSGAGDVNGDGLADLIIGAPYADSLSGESYVVFGKANSATVDLANLGAGGFRIAGISADNFAGYSVSGAGDVNGDGLADLIVGAKLAGVDSLAGESYVVFGKMSSTAVDLANLGSGGFTINGIDSGDFLGHSVAGAGDVNGDGLADLIVGAYGADAGGDRNSGESYVVFGKASSTPVDLANLGNGGFVSRALMLTTTRAGASPARAMSTETASPISSSERLGPILMTSLVQAKATWSLERPAARRSISGTWARAASASKVSLRVTARVGVSPGPAM